MKVILNKDLENQENESVNIGKRIEKSSQLTQSITSISIAENYIKSIIYSFLQTEREDSKDSDFTFKSKRKNKNNFNILSPLNNNHVYRKFSIKTIDNKKRKYNCKQKQTSLKKLKKKYECLENSVLYSDMSKSSRRKKKRSAKHFHSTISIDENKNNEDADKNKSNNEKEIIEKNKYYSVIPEPIKKTELIEKTVPRYFSLKTLKKIDYFEILKNNLQKNIIIRPKNKLTNPINKDQIIPYSKFFDSESKKCLINLENDNIYINEKFRKLFHKNLVYDSVDDEEIEDIDLEDKYINPNSKICFLIDLLVFSSTIISSINIPYFLANKFYLYKNKNHTLFIIFNYFFDTIYVIDIILSFFKAYYDFDEKLIKDNKKIIGNYLCTWFLIDFIAGIPFYTILHLYECSFRNNTNELCYLFLYLKMIKLYKIFKNNQIYNKIYKILEDYNRNLILISKIFVIILTFHFGACINIFIGQISHPSWITHLQIEDKSFIEIYVGAIYFVTTTITTVGYGDITCYSMTERVYQIILLLFGILTYSWVVSSVSVYIEKSHSYLKDYIEKKEILDEIKLHHPDMSIQLYNKITRHLKYKNKKERLDKKLIFDCLPISLKNNLIYEMYKPIITNFIFFKYFGNLDFIVKVILSFRPIIALKNDILLNDGDMVEEIIFVKKGILIVQLPINFENPEENVRKITEIDLFNNNSLNFQKENIKIFNDNHKLKYISIVHIRENEHFGDVLMFSEERSFLRLKVVSPKAELFYLKKVDAIKIFSNFGDIRKEINKKSVHNFEQLKKSAQKIIQMTSSKINSKNSITKLNRISKKKKKPTTKKQSINDSFQKINTNIEENLLNKIKYESSSNLSSSSEEKEENDVIENEKININKINLNDCNNQKNINKEEHESNQIKEKEKENNITKYSSGEINQELYPNEKFQLNNCDNIEDDKLSHKTITKVSFLKIETGINFEIASSYENINSLSKNTYIHDTDLQQKIKLYLNEQFCNQNINKLNFTNTKNASPGPNKTSDKNNGDKRKKNNSISNTSKLLNSLNDSSSNKKIKRMSTFEALNICKKKKKKNSNFSSLFKPNSRNNLDKSPLNNPRRSKRSSSLLSKINNNILNSSQNLINPDKFYTRLFKSVVNKGKQKIMKSSKKTNRIIGSNQKLFTKLSKIYKEDY